MLFRSEADLVVGTVKIYNSATTVGNISDFTYFNIDEIYSNGSALQLVMANMSNGKMGISVTGSAGNGLSLASCNRNTINAQIFNNGGAGIVNGAGCLANVFIGHSFANVGTNFSDGGTNTNFVALTVL